MTAELMELINAAPVAAMTARFFWRTLGGKRPFLPFALLFSGCQLALEACYLFAPAVVPAMNPVLLTVLYQLADVLVSCLLLILLTRAKLGKTLIFLCVSQLIRVASSILAAVLICMLTGFSIREFSSTAAGNLQLDLLSGIFAVALLILTGEWFVRKLHFSESGARWNAFSPVVCGQIASLFIVASVMDLYNADLSVPLYAGLLAFYVVSDFILLHAFSDLAENAQLKGRLVNLESERAYEREYYLAAADQLRVTQRMRHDFRNVLVTIDALLDKGETKRAKDIPDNYRNSIGGHVWVMFTGNEIIDAVINKKALEAKKDGFEIDAQLLLPDPFPLSEFDSMSLFTNLIDNALEHMRLLPPESSRVLAISSAIRAGFFLLRISNDCLKNQLDGDALPVTTKADAANHGHGLGIVKEIAERYDGSLKLSIQNGRFVAMVAINLSDEPEK